MKRKRKKTTPIVRRDLSLKLCAHIDDQASSYAHWGEVVAEVCKRT